MEKPDPGVRWRTATLFATSAAGFALQFTEGLAEPWNNLLPAIAGGIGFVAGLLYDTGAFNVKANKKRAHGG